MGQQPETKKSVRRIILGVGGGIAAYKSATIVRGLTEQGHKVRVIPTEAALRFIGKATFEALSHEPVSTDVFNDVDTVAHIELGKSADLVVIAPATADLLARLALGITDNLLTATVLTARCPILVVPAMHTEMWDHPATQRNVELLRSYGYYVLHPASGRLTCKDIGVGRLPEPEEIISFANLLLDAPEALERNLLRKKILISAGGTKEALDPVRFLTNRSSGKQGYALARIAAQRGADVTLVAGSTANLADPAAVTVDRVDSAQQMYSAMEKYAAHADIIIMAAAVADFKPATVAHTKLKKNLNHQSDGYQISLTENPDILAELVKARDKQQHQALIVGFAAETGDKNHSVIEYAQAKLERKGCDLLVVNAVGNGNAFEVDDNSGWVLRKNADPLPLKYGSKMLMAANILDVIAENT